MVVQISPPPPGSACRCLQKAVHKTLRFSPAKREKAPWAFSFRWADGGSSTCNVIARPWESPQGLPRSFQDLSLLILDPRSPIPPDPEKVPPLPIHPTKIPIPQHFLPFNHPLIPPPPPSFFPQSQLRHISLPSFPQNHPSSPISLHDPYPRHRLPQPLPIPLRRHELEFLLGLLRQQEA